MKLEASERKVLHALMRVQPLDSAGYVQDSTIVEVTGLSIDDVRDSLVTLTEKECAELTPTEVGCSAYITAKGRRLLRQILMTHVHGFTVVPEPQHIIPKGLKSYDQSDKDFFFELLPGPRHLGNIPASVHFWKSRIEDKDVAHRHPLGVLSGPSGCGKTSFVKAGLLPQLHAAIHVAYIDVRLEEEGELHLRIRECISPYLERSCDRTSQPDHMNMPPTLPLKRVLLVLDQFEHCFLIRQQTEITELVTILKTHAGQQLQTILVVRNDFYDLTEQFIDMVGLSFNPEDDTVHMNFFPKYHATRVLEAFGQAYRILGDRITRDQKRFLHEAVDGLCDEEHVVPIHLALLFEMLKGIEWKPDILRKKGGPQGVIEAFLASVLSAKNPNLRYRQHRDAAKAVLRALLPTWLEARKPPIRTFDVLVKIAGYHKSIACWHELMQILDAEIRLVKPIVLPVNNDEGNTDRQQFKLGWQFCYQLTHELYVSVLKRLLYPLRIASYFRYITITVYTRKR